MNLKIENLLMMGTIRYKRQLGQCLSLSLSIALYILEHWKRERKLKPIKLNMLFKKAIPLSKPVRMTEGINSGIQSKGHLKLSTLD